MTAFINETPSYDLADFIDPIGELVSAVLDWHLGGVPRQVAAVDVCDARHGDGLIYSECLELAMQSRALHADEFRRA